MDNTNVISILETCFQVCVAFTVMFFIINVILFFVFDIRALFNIRTGRAKRKTIKEMQAANDSTGRLRVGGKTLTAQLEKENGNGKKGRKAVITPPSHQNEGASATTVLKYGEATTDVLSNSNSAVQPYDPGTAPTSQLTVDQKNVSVRRGTEYNEVYSDRDIHFVVTKCLIYTHTDEVIEQ